MIYDSLCESLDSLRPYGLNGKTLPWKINPTKFSYTEITE